MSESIIITDQQEPKPKKNQRLWMRIGLTVSLLTVIAVVLVVMAYLMGRLYVGFKDQNQKAIVQTAVCSVDPLLTKLNDSFTSSDYRENIKGLVGDIQASSNYMEDPTCVQALVTIYTESYDVSNAETYFNRLKELADRGMYPSNKLIMSSSIQSAKDALYMIKG